MHLLIHSESCFAGTRRLPDSFMDRNTFGSNVATVRCIADAFRYCALPTLSVIVCAKRYGVDLGAATVRVICLRNFPSLEPTVYPWSSASPEKCYSEAIRPFCQQGFVRSKLFCSSSCSAKQAFCWSIFCCVHIPCFVVKRRR
jgi:hypothetical protein